MSKDKETLDLSPYRIKLSKVLHYAAIMYTGAEPHPNAKQQFALRMITESVYKKTGEFLTMEEAGELINKLIDR